MTRRRWLRAGICLALALGSRPSLALDPAGGPPERTATEAWDEREDASVGDDEAPPQSRTEPEQRSWLAQGSGTARADASAPADSGRSSGFTLGALLIVLALGAAAIVLRQRRRQRAPMPASESRLTVLSSSRIGPKAYAVTAHVGGRVLLLGVTDHSVSHLGWLDGAESELSLPQSSRAQGAPQGDADELPDDYPGSALRGAHMAPGPLASSSDLKRFQEVLRGAVQSRSSSPARPSEAQRPTSAASTLAAQTSDVVAASSPAPAPTSSPSSLRRKRQRRRENLPADAESERAPSPSPTAEAPMEGQVAGLRALRNS